MPSEASLGAIMNSSADPTETEQMAIVNMQDFLVFALNGLVLAFDCESQFFWFR